MFAGRSIALLYTATYINSYYPYQSFCRNGPFVNGHLGAYFMALKLINPFSENNSVTVVEELHVYTLHVYE